MLREVPEAVMLSGIFISICHYSIPDIACLSLTGKFIVFVDEVCGTRVFVLRCDLKRCVCIQKKENRMSVLFLLISSVANYSATTLSHATLSQQTLSQATLSQATLSQQTALSQAVLSAHSVPVVLLPQEAKETATIAANTNANFFIFVTF